MSSFAVSKIGRLTTCNRSPSSSAPLASWKKEPAVRPNVITSRKRAVNRHRFVLMEQIR